jgi:CspA family cold shock protein
MQGVIRTYDPTTGEGVVVRDTDREELVLAADALEGSIFRMLRQGQRICPARAARVAASAEAAAARWAPDIQV